jgi:hypothetical protein
METILRGLRAPFVVASIVMGGVLMFLFLSAVSVGSWYEALLIKVGLSPRGWIPPALGFLSFAAGGVWLPALATSAIIGWPGIIIGPSIMIWLVSRLDRW